MSQCPCPVCQGRRLKMESLAVTVGGMSIYDFTTLPVNQALRFLDGITLTNTQMMIADRILKEIRERLGFLRSVGLEYLTLSRSAATLSGGESQRIRLASQIGSGLTGVLYVLDEPSIGLHQRDNARLLDTLRRLRDLGNTVIVVEHDEDAIETADYVVDVGPGAGVHGGNIVAQGTPQQVMNNPNSMTGKYLIGEMYVPIPERPTAQSPPHHQGHQRARQQSQECVSGNSARTVHLRHRRLGRRQIDTADRYAVQIHCAQAQQCLGRPCSARSYRGA